MNWHKLNKGVNLTIGGCRGGGGRQGSISMLFTARVRSTTGRLCFDTCLSVCPQRGGVPIMLCNISQNAMGQTPGGVPCKVQPGGGGTLPGGGTLLGVPCRGGTQLGYPPSQVRTGGVPCWGGGGTQLGQQKEYSLHGRRYASCVHAGGLSCSGKFWPIIGWRPHMGGRGWVCEILDPSLLMGLNYWSVYFIVFDSASLSLV